MIDNVKYKIDPYNAFFSSPSVLIGESITSYINQTKIFKYVTYGSGNIEPNYALSTKSTNCALIIPIKMRRWL